MSLVLNYFNFPGRAEATRRALTIVGVQFEDKRHTSLECKAFGFNGLPVLKMPAAFYMCHVVRALVMCVVREDPYRVLQSFRGSVLLESCAHVRYIT